MPAIKGRLITPALSGAPSSPTVGELYYNTGTNTLYVWNGTSWVDLAATGGGGSATPAGIVEAYAGSVAPSGYLLCDGSAVSRTTYAALFSAIGTTYGVGDGSTTFNVPDLRGDVIVGQAASGTFATLGSAGGEESHVLSVAELAQHSHANTATFTGTAMGTHGHAGSTFTGSAVTSGAEAAHTHGFTPTGTVSSHTHRGTNAANDMKYTSNQAGSAGTFNLVNDIAGIVGATSGTNANWTTGATQPTFTGSAGTTGAGSSHTHSVTAAGTISIAAVSAGTPAGTVAMTNANTGSGTAHNNLQPYTVMNYVIKT